MILVFGFFFPPMFPLRVERFVDARERCEEDAKTEGVVSRGKGAPVRRWNCHRRAHRAVSPAVRVPILGRCAGLARSARQRLPKGGLALGQAARRIVRSAGASGKVAGGSA
jgi:hypothetical protein